MLSHAIITTILMIKSETPLGRGTFHFQTWLGAEAPGHLEGLELWGRCGGDPRPVPSVQTSAFSQESHTKEPGGQRGWDGDLTRSWEEGERKT